MSVIGWIALVAAVLAGLVVAVVTWKNRRPPPPPAVMPTMFDFPSAPKDPDAKP